MTDSDLRLLGWPATDERATWKEMRDCRIVDDETVEHPACIDDAGMFTQLGPLKPPERSRW